MYPSGNSLNTLGEKASIICRGTLSSSFLRKPLIALQPDHVDAFRHEVAMGPGADHLVHETALSQFLNRSSNSLEWSASNRLSSSSRMILIGDSQASATLIPEYARAFSEPLKVR